MSSTASNVALNHACNRLLNCCFVVPTMSIVVVPFVMSLTLGLFNAVTRGRGGAALSVSLMLGFACYHFIQTLPASAEAKRRALRRNIRYVPILILLGILVVRMTPGIFPRGPFWSSIPVGMLVRICALSVFLGMTVCARFVGPRSIVRCSSIPLAENPALIMWREVVSFVYMKAGETNRKHIDHTQQGPRFQSFTLVSGFAQTCYAAVLAVACAFFLARPLNIVTSEQWWTCVFVMLASLTLPMLCLPHEINPKKLTPRFGQSLQRAASSGMFTTLGTALVACLLGGKSWLLLHASWLGALFAVGTGVSAYLELLNQTVHMLLFYPPDGFRSPTQQKFLNPDMPLVDVMMYGILRTHDADTLLYKPLNERDECNSIQKYARTMAVKQNVEESLANDVLQLSLLESLASTRKGLRSIMATEHALPILRTLCIFISSRAELLMRCFPGGSTSYWALPPGFLCATEYAVVGLAACINEGLVRRNDHVLPPFTTVLPSALESTFALVVALQDFAQRLGQQRIGINNPEILQLIRICEGATVAWANGKPVKPIKDPTRAWLREVVDRSA